MSDLDDDGRIHGDDGEVVRGRLGVVHECVDECDEEVSVARDEDERVASVLVHGGFGIDFEPCFIFGEVEGDKVEDFAPARGGEDGDLIDVESGDDGLGDVAEVGAIAGDGVLIVVFGGSDGDFDGGALLVFEEEADESCIFLALGARDHGVRLEVGERLVVVQELHGGLTGRFALSRVEAPLGGL